MTRTKRKHLLRALKRDGPLPLGGPDRLTMGNSINRQGHKGACAVIQPALKTATCIDGQSESPLSLGSTDLLARRKANNHQGYKEACVVSLPINKDASLPATGPLPTSSPDILEQRQDNKPQLQKKRRAVSSSTARAMSHRVHKPRNPPPQYASATAKKIARAYRKLKPSDDSYFIICSPSKARVSRKPIINLPVLNKPPRQIVLSSSLAPHFIFETHSFDVNPPTPTFTKLCEVIETLHAMAKYRPCNKRNANRLNGEMHLIGFRPGNDRGKSAGTYARRTDLTPAQSAHDDTLWAKLQSFNKFLSQRMEAISHSAYQQNKELMNKRGIPNWSQEEWAEMRKEDQIEFQFASNVSVTYNDFYNKPHQDKKDINGWTYGIFASVDLETGKPIPPPSTELGHGFLFPCHAYLIDFVKSSGIMELVWQTTKFEHCTTMPPPSLRKQKGRTWTHQGCSFQINKDIAKVAQELKDASPQFVEKKTLCKKQKYGA
ncbi:uncharacterized protein PGTG_20411 [Puccinia graminis f. sp. tritici CRL 75-36-700-3]|uniref:Tet-like 2OG-Fe(II) oxygenase domain-containing protein n=1 Tax=Puccinia graminis f. sp. tritici (strain CRL 75-36-700-3 / race SCCL) TaxID=418459 RepID=E3NY06_PUCGT|nr:uncharacterized protein PGTG_20411 [Puccinia graminis f. sp. tritici CRL 75-36-700-3]EFP94455.1 hypothetical protein PGTG_20411 [Puccinia graminis f. sp. tritici CRL 75-36-700-3]